jgi:hypothetical protein
MRKLGTVLITLALCAVALAAQAPSTPAQTQPAPAADGSTVTATGCLRAGEQPGTFVLERVRWKTAPDGPAGDGAAHHDASTQRDRPTTPATAAAGQRETPPAGETIRLAGAAEKLKLSEHVGHTVTVTGMIAPRDPVVRPGVLLPDAPRGGDTTSRSTAAEDKASAFPRVLNVRSVSHVAGECK